MLIKELKGMKDPEIRQKGVNLLYNSKKLSNQNIDCYVTGFKDALNSAEYEIRDFVEAVKAHINTTFDDINMSCSYRCRDYSENEKIKMRRYRHILELLEPLTDYINKEEITMTFKF